VQLFLFEVRIFIENWLEKAMYLFLQIVGYTLLVYVLLVSFMYFRQESFLFFPTAARHEAHGFAGVENYSLNRGEATLHGWLVNPGYVREKLIVYFGGNAEDVFLNVDEYQDIQAASLFVAYRGYGPSSGSPGEMELYGDALAVLDDMRNRYGAKNVYLIGRSLGSGVACYAALHRQVRGLVLVTPYDSVENLAKQVYPWLPVGLLLRHRFDTVSYLPWVKCPVLIIYGGQDTVVPPVRTRNLISHLPAGGRVVFIESAEHGTIDMFGEYWEAVLQFINP
jgi:pimeloyl-ACP methyl ester carboxylesterase